MKIKADLSSDVDDVLLCSVWQGCTCCRAVSHQLSILAEAKRRRSVASIQRYLEILMNLYSLSKEQKESVPQEKQDESKNRACH